MFKKGFISTFYFGYLLISVSIIATIETQLQLRIKTLLNIKEVYKTYDLQIKIIDFIQCELLNDRLEEKFYEKDDVQFEVLFHDDEVIVRIIDCAISEIIINLDSHNKIMDYYVKSPLERQ